MHTDGTIFTVDDDSIVGVNPVTHEPFTISLEKGSSFDGGNCGEFPPISGSTSPVVSSQAIIAGDGFAYFAYYWANSSKTYACPSGQISLVSDTHLRVVRVGTDGTYLKINVGNWGGGSLRTLNLGTLITDADQGALYSWGLCAGPQSPCSAQYYLTSIAGNGNPATVPTSLGFSGSFVLPVVPVLQRQDGTYIGSIGDAMVAFDKTGRKKWSQPNYTPKIATADGGVIAQSGGGTAAMFDQDGSSTGQIASLPT